MAGPVRQGDARRRARGRPRPAAAEEPSPETAKAVALRVLAFHARSELQLRRRLERSGLGPFADETLAWLRRLGYVDDAAYANARARALLARRTGPIAAERRLREAGIAPALARAAIDGALQERSRGTPGAAELDLCREALRARLRGADPASLDRRGRARLARFLLGRGFSAAAVARATGLPLDGDD